MFTLFYVKLTVTTSVNYYSFVASQEKAHLDTVTILQS